MGLAVRTASGTITEQKLSTHFATARCRGKWNESELQTNGERGTRSQSPMNNGPLEGGYVLPLFPYIADSSTQTVASTLKAFSININCASVIFIDVAQDNTTVLATPVPCIRSASSSYKPATCHVLRWSASAGAKSDGPCCGGTGTDTGTGTSRRPVSTIPSQYSQSLISCSRINSCHDATNRFPY